MYIQDLKSLGIMFVDIHDSIEIAQEAAIQAGKAIMEIYRSGEFEKNVKSDQSPVTRADKTAHSIISKHLARTRLPVLSEEARDDEFQKRRYWEYFWLLDPLDGTKEFITQNSEFTVNIALIRRSTPIAGVIFAPFLNTLYSGSQETGVKKIEKGQVIDIPPLNDKRQLNDLMQHANITMVASRSHMNDETRAFINRFHNVTLFSLGSSLKFMSLIENKADIYPRMGVTMEWDTAAAHAILNASNRGIYRSDLTGELEYNKPILRNPFFAAF